MAGTGRGRRAHPMNQLETLGEGSLLEALFTAQERWGWEHREPDVTIRPFPHPRPVPYLPWPDWAAEMAARQARAGGQRAAMILAGGLAVLLALVIAGWQPDWALNLLAVGCTVGYLGAIHPRDVRRQAQARHGRWLADCVAVHDRHQRALRKWTTARDEHRRHQLERRPAPEWAALAPSVPCDRIDVHGGTTYGWEALVTSAGASLLGAGARLTVVDLSREQVAAELVQLAERSGIATEVVLVPAWAERPELPGRTAAGLQVIAVSAPGPPPAGDLLADLLARLLVEGVREDPGVRERDRAARELLMVIGADPLQRSHLERLAPLARRRGIRLVHLFAHLRDDAIDLLGGGAALLMRLDDPSQAASAAELAGSGQRVLLHQLTRSASERVTHAARQLPPPGAGRPGYQSRRSRAWGRSRALASGEHGGGESPSQRQVHEAVVEPELLRSLPETAFLLVEPQAGGPGARPRLGDCNPDIVTLANPAARAGPLVD
jgi:hypothetical protein